MKQVQALFERLTIALSVHPRIVFCFMGMLICVAVYSLLLIKEVDGSNYRMHTQKVEITSDIWASEPITTHKFLAFTHENKAPYLSRPVLSTITYVLLHNLFDVVFDLASHWSTFMFHVSFASLSLTILLLHFYEKRHFVLYLCAYLTITTLVICSGNFFHYFYYFDHDNFFPITGVCYGMLACSHYFCNKPFPKPLILVYLIPLVIFGHLATFLFLLFFLIFENGKIKTTWILLSIIGLVLNVQLPYILGDASLVGSGSGFELRSGLNGETSRLAHHFQAFFEPRWEGGSIQLNRWLAPLSSLIILLICLQYWDLDSLLIELRKLSKCLALSLIGFFPDWIVFPQSVSVHPYLYDFSWMMPMFIITSAFVLRTVAKVNVLILDLRSFYACMGLVLILMANLLHISQLG